MSQTPKRAVVFVYHDVGVACLQALIDAGMQVDLVITHADDPNERIWFGSAQKLCDQQGLPCRIVKQSELLTLLPQIKEIAPDYLFSFYYRFMLPTELLETATIAALNMHGSLLPKYRGRAPVNWAVLHGETETGATLHVMEANPDAGDIVGQIAVPIGIHETGKEVFDKVSQAAKQVMEKVIPSSCKETFLAKSIDWRKVLTLGVANPRMVASIGPSQPCRFTT